MTLEERLTQAGVTTLAELEAKIKADAASEVTAKATAEEAKLRKQITDLETIKASQGGEIGELRKDKEALAEAKRKLAEFESKKTDNGNPNPPAEKSEDDWKQANSEREKAFKDEDWNKVDAAMKAAPPEAKTLIKTEAGRAAFYDRVLGSGSVETQETLRRPVQKEKLTVAEQLDAYLNKGKQPVRVPARQPSGIVPSTPNPNQNQSGEAVVNASFADRMKAIQTQ